MEVTNQKLNLYVPNFYHLDDFPWRKKFRGLQTIFASSIEEKSQSSQIDLKFKKFLRASASKMIQNKMYEFDNSSVDPLNKLPEHVHELIFQHLDGKDALNLLEVSQSWKIFVAQERKIMSKIQLKLSEEMTKIDENVISESVRKFQSVSCFSNRLLLMENFCQYLKKISIIANDGNDYGEKLNFPNLEILIVKSDFGRFCRIGNVLRVFEECRKLKVRNFYINLTLSLHFLTLN
jgi:hypothetical protein